LRHPRYERSGKLSQLTKLTLSAQAIGQILKLRTCQFDWGIDLVSTRNDLLGKWLLWAAGCNQTSGPNGAHSWMLHRANAEPKSHQTRLLASRFPNEWGIKGETDPAEFMPGSLRWQGQPDAPTVLAPFAGTAAKQWPEDRWVQLFEALKAKGQVQVLVPEPELARNREFLNKFPDASLQIVKTIQETLQTLITSGGCIVLDTAVAHYAWLTGTPYLQLFSGTTLVERWAPCGGGVTLQNRPECYPCQSEVCLQPEHLCMDDFQVDDVLRNFEELEASK
jgi:NADH:ubiquinone oxidoreductase subunit